MSLSRHIFSCLLFTSFLLVCSTSEAQLGYNLEIKKPEPYENRELKAERSGKKKFTRYKRFFQNTYTHYNYFFNANNKLNEIIARAKESHKDDYATLLPFYNYSLEVTAQDNTQLDSVIYKSKTGIVMHDLRNDWIDDLYLLWGAAYFFQQKLDSAYQMFQFINHSFAEKEKDGYYRYIGSRMDGNSALSVVTKEDDGLIKRMISDPPSRNTAFIWQIRTLIEADAMAEAGSLITTLQKDPNFPERLVSSLEEVKSYWFYKQQMWDSAAAHLENALGNAANKFERSRWEYLLGQLYSLSKKPEAASEFYNKAINHTTDPVMDVYARLNLIRINRSGGEDYIDKNISELLRMARREKYEDYRDVIYFMAAQMEMERGNPLAAQEYLLKGAKFYNNDIKSRNRSFLQLADLSYAQKKYKAASAFYDSLQMAELSPSDADRVRDRKQVLSKVVANLAKLNHQDSLQKIAALPEQERNDYLKKLARQLRRQQGLKEEETANTSFNGTAPATPVYTTQSKGEWYFYNTTLKTQGVATFKQQWGSRPNVDNWRRASDATAELRNANPNNTRGDVVPEGNATAPGTSVESLLANLPLTPQQLNVSNEVIRTALLTLGLVYKDEIEDYPSAVQAFEELRRRFPEYNGMDELLFNLYYSYLKTGEDAKATEIKNLLLKTYPASRQSAIVKTGKDPASTEPSKETTSEYEKIYDLFIEGKFAEALASKRVADSTYKTNFWSPQLLYIEAMYHAREREDSLAKNTLNIILQQHPNTPLSAKAENFIQVLSRRKEIEEELRNLNIERPKEDTVEVVPEIVGPAPITRDTTMIRNNSVVKTKTEPTLRADSKIVVAPPPVLQTTKSYTYDVNAPQYVVVVLNKVDNIFGNEARNAFNRYNQEKYYSLPLKSEIVPLDAENKLLLIGNFSNVVQAIEYTQKAAAFAPREIVPWLKAEKYSFTVISQANLEVLKNDPDLNAYRRFFEEHTGTKF